MKKTEIKNQCACTALDVLSLIWCSLQQRLLRVNGLFLDVLVSYNSDINMIEILLAHQQQQSLERDLNLLQTGIKFPQQSFLLS